MTDDFHLFADNAAGDSGDANVDADIALITAYLAQELSLVQIAAVESRLATDPAFRESVGPIIEGWLVPGLSDSSTAGQSPSRSATMTAPLAPAEIDRGWQRYVTARDARPKQAPVKSPVRPAAVPSRSRRISMTRIAAVIAMTVLPMFAFAQVVTYAASHAGVPGHGLAQRLAAPFMNAGRQAAGDAKSGPRPTDPQAISDFPPGSALWQHLVAGGQSGQPGQPMPAHLLGPVLAKSSASLGSAAQLVALSDGRVMVSDPVRRLVQLFDPMLANPKIVLDSAMAQANTFSSGIGAPVLGGGAAGQGSGRNPGAAPNPDAQPKPYLISFRADSALWFDPVSSVFTVIDPSGRIVRTLPPPPLASITRDRNGPPPASSSRLGLVYKVTPLPTTQSANGIRVSVPPGDGRWLGPDTVFATEPPTDSVLAVRYNFDTRVVDTLGALTAGRVQLQHWSADGTTFHGVPVHEPVRFVDDVVATSDGSIVTLRAREYRLDWITPGGARTAQPLSYPWRRITSEMRKDMIDSAEAPKDFSTVCLGLNAPWVADSTQFGRVPVNSGQTTRPCRGMAPPAPSPTPVNRLGRGIPYDPTGGAWVFGVPFPDYFAPVPTQDALRADADGNVWIQQILPPPGDPGYTVWDIVSRTRGVIDRVRIPNTRTLIGFGPGGIVYLAAYDAGVARLEKVRVK